MSQDFEDSVSFVEALAAGDPEALALAGIPAKIAALAAAARKERLARRAVAPPAAGAPARLSSVSIPAVPAQGAARALPSSSQGTTMTSLAAPLPSRAAQMAEIHLAGVNDSRKRCGLAPLTAAELTHEFADVDQTPPRTKGNRQARANVAAARFGGLDLLTQAGIDAMWSGIAAKLNASLPARREPIAGPASGPRGASSTAAKTSATVDWGSIATELNREAGLQAPSRSRAR